MVADLSDETWALFWDIQGSADYIVSRKYTIVTLQFPDDLLKEATRVSRALQDACAAKGLLVKVLLCWLNLIDNTYILHYEHSILVNSVTICISQTFLSSRGTCLPFLGSHD